MSTRAQRRRFLFHCLATSARADVDNGSEYLEQGPDGGAGVEQLQQELLVIAEEFERRSRKGWERSRDG